MVYFTRTGCPFCMPGFHLGMALMTRTASASISSLTFFRVHTGTDPFVHRPCTRRVQTRYPPPDNDFTTR